MILSLLLLMGMQAPQYQVNWMSRLTGTHGSGNCMVKMEADAWAARGDDVIAYWVTKCDPKAAPNGVLENVGDEPGGMQTGQVWLPTAGPHFCGDTCRIAAPEPLDVPAIQHEEFSYTNGLVTCIHCYRSTATCADKTRILEHDEQVPPLYWCRKVQTK